MVAVRRPSKGLKSQVAYKMLRQLGHQPDENGAITVTTDTPDVFEMLLDMDFLRIGNAIKVEPSLRTHQITKREDKIEWQKQRAGELAERKTVAEEPVPEPGPRRSAAEQKSYLEKLVVRKEPAPPKEPEVKAAPASRKSSFCSRASSSTAPGTRTDGELDEGFTSRPFGETKRERVPPPEPKPLPEVPAVFKRLFPEPKVEPELPPPPPPDPALAEYQCPKVCRQDQQESIARLSTARARPTPPDSARMPTVRRDPAEQLEYMTTLMTTRAIKEKDKDTDFLALTDPDPAQGVLVCVENKEEYLGALLPSDGRLSRISEAANCANIPKTEKKPRSSAREVGAPYRTKLPIPEKKIRRKRQAASGEAITPRALCDIESDDSDSDDEKMDEEELMSKIDAMIQEDDEAVPPSIREGIQEVLWSALLVHRSNPEELPEEVTELPLRGMADWMPPSLLTRLENELPQFFEALQGEFDENELPTQEEVTDARNALLRHAFEKPREGKVKCVKKPPRKSSLSYWTEYT